MAKFNDYWFRAESADGNTLVESTVSAISRESAWMKAVSLAFDSLDKNVGEWPETITVVRKHAPSEIQG